MTLRVFVLVSAIVAVPCEISGQAVADTAVAAQLRRNEIRIAELSASVEVLEAQLTAVSTVAQTSLNTLSTAMMIVSAAIAVMFGLAGFFGYRDLRSRVDILVDSRIREIFDERMAMYFEPRFEAKQREWDKTIATLVKRYERLMEPNRE